MTARQRRWHRLPREAVAFPSLGAFKKRVGIAMAVSGPRMDSVTLEVFSNRHNSMTATP